MKYYYNGYLLPEIPKDYIKDYPYCFIRRNTAEGYFDLVLTNVKFYIDEQKTDEQKNSLLYTADGQRYRIPINGYEGYENWNYYKFDAGYYSVNSTTLKIVWSNIDIYKNSSYTGEIYLQGCEPIPETSISIRKFLIQDEDKYYTVADSSLSEVSITELNAQSFESYGFDDLPDGTLLATLSHPKLLYWQSDESAELPNITAKVTATPNEQSISKVIDLSNASIIGIKAVTVKCAGTPWFSCSFDGGNTWMEYSGGSWIEVESYGMTEETLTAITSDEWNAVTSGIDSFIMRVLLRDSADSLTNLSVNFLNKTT